jgi:hypothetical protein
MDSSKVGNFTAWRRFAKLLLAVTPKKKAGD